MRIKINGEDAKVAVATKEASTKAALWVVAVGWLVAAIWWVIWL